MEMSMIKDKRFQRSKKKARTRAFLERKAKKAKRRQDRVDLNVAIETGDFDVCLKLLRNL
jgi:hypothetical protein